MPTCRDCAYFRDDSYGFKTYYRCLDDPRKKVFPDSSICDNFNSKDKKDEYQRSGCYITTIVCTILNKKDDDAVLNSLRNLRDNFLKLNPKYYPLLYEYDQIGPLISKYLMLDKNKDALALYLWQNYLVPAAILWHQSKPLAAVNYYLNMVNILKQRYGLTNIVLDLNSNISLENLGKARIRTKTSNA